MKFFMASLVLSGLVFNAACTKSSDSSGGNSGGEISNTVNLGSVGETMTYDKGDITVKSGQDVTLTFKNNSTTLQHNWVLVKPGKENDVGLAGINAGLAKGFIPDDPAVVGDIIAHTKLVDPNGSDTVTFKAPPPGDYPYICTNAGHHTVMKGVLHSK